MVENLYGLTWMMAQSTFVIPGAVAPSETLLKVLVSPAFVGPFSVSDAERADECRRYEHLQQCFTGGNSARYDEGGLRHHPRQAVKVLYHFAQGLSGMRALTRATCLMQETHQTAAGEGHQRK